MADNRSIDLEERLLILRDKAAREDFRVPDEVLDYIAEKFALPQTLKGALINVSAYAQRRNLPVTMDVARLVLDGIRPSATPVVVEETAPPAEEPQTESVVVETLPGMEAEAAVADAPELPEIPAQAPAPVSAPVSAPASAPSPASAPISAPVESLEDALASVLDATVTTYEEPEPHAAVVEPAHVPTPVIPGPAVVPAPATPAYAPQPVTPAPQPVTPAAQPVTPAYAPPAPQPSTVWFAPMRTAKKESLVARVGRLLQRAGIKESIAEGDLVAVKLHFGEEGNTGFVSPVFLREVVKQVRDAGGKPFLTDSNTLYRGQRANAVEHLACAVHNGFSYATVDAPSVIADGLTGQDAIDVPITGFDHFDSVRIGAAAVHADAMVVVTHVKGHEATGMGGALKNVGMGLGCRSAKQRMHSDLKPQVAVEKCTGCGRCVKWCPVHAILLIDRVAVIDHDLCYGCGECVAACPTGSIGIQWKTEPAAIQEKIVEHVAGAVEGKSGKVVYLSFVNNVSPDCDCWNFTDASIVSDIGVLASTDIVAIDQAAFDLVRKARGLAGSRGEGMSEGTDKFREITGVDATLGLSYAEKHGLGIRTYELKTLD